MGGRFLICHYYRKYILKARSQTRPGPDMGAQGALGPDRTHHDSMDGSTVHRRDYAQQSRHPRALSPDCPPLTLPARWQSERRPIDRPSYWSPAASYQRIMAPLNIPCSRCPGFCRQVHAQHHQHGAHGAMAAHKALSHVPRTQTRSRTRLHMQHTGGLMRELIAVGIREFCGQWATDAFVTPWASTNTRARTGGARDGPSGRPFGQSAWP